MVLWKKLWYITENYRTSIYEGNRHCRLPKPNKKKTCNILEELKFLKKFIT